MIQFNKPNNLNGKELRDELNAAGVVISYDKNSVLVNAEGYLVLEIDSSDEAKAAAIIAAHNGTTVAPQPTIETKLASVGLSLDELRAALGGN
jgi:hypothetical protein